MKFKAISFSLALVGFIGAAGTSRADIVPFLCGTTGSGCANGVVYNAATKDYTYNYSLSVAQNEIADPNQVNGSTGTVTGSFITFYDIPGFVVGSAIKDTTSTGVTVSEQLLGVNPAGNGCCTPTDNPAMYNVTFYIKGPNPVSGVTDFGFAFESTIGPSTALGTFSDLAEKNGAGNPSEYQTGSVLLPSAPEPVSMLLMGSALVGLGLLRKKILQ
jgi:hypothetical protein